MVKPSHLRTGVAAARKALHLTPEDWLHVPNATTEAALREDVSHAPRYRTAAVALAATKTNHQTITSIVAPT